MTKFYLEGNFRDAIDNAAYRSYESVEAAESAAIRFMCFNHENNLYRIVAENESGCTFVKNVIRTGYVLA